MNKVIKALRSPAFGFGVVPGLMVWAATGVSFAHYMA